MLLVDSVEGRRLHVYISPCRDCESKIIRSLMAFEPCKPFQVSCVAYTVVCLVALEDWAYLSSSRSSYCHSLMCFWIGVALQCDYFCADITARLRCVIPELSQDVIHAKSAIL